MARECNNCYKPHGVFGDHCLVRVLLGILVAEGTDEFTHATARELIGKIDVDALWSDMSPILDNLRDGEYLLPEEEDGGT
jgi:hypothetical protein